MSRRLTDVCVALLLGAVLLAVSLSSPNIAGGDDAYRHVRFANRLITDWHGALADPWHLVYLWNKPVDMWFGYHLLLAPFTLVFPLIVAAKVCGILVWTATVFALLRFLDKLEVEWRHVWVTLAVAGSSLVLFRAMLVRPFSLSLLLVILAARYTLEEKPWKVAAISALHAFSYSMFFFVGLPVAVYFLVRRTMRGFILGIASAAGMLAGLAASPFFPENAKFAWSAATSQASPEMAVRLKAGGELLPLSGWLLLASLPILLIWGTAVVAKLRRRVHLNDAQWMLLGLGVVTFAAALRASRFMDYFVPFAALSAATLITPPGDKRLFAHIGAGVLFTVSLGLSSVSAQGSLSIERYRAISEFLHQENAKLVFNTAWQQYPPLYFWNPQSRYVTGMEPGLFHSADPERYWQWRKLADDAVTETEPLAHLAFVEFGASHMVVDRDKTPRLARQLRAHARFEEVFHDHHMSAFAPRHP
jgi:hypothetical protein